MNKKIVKNIVGTAFIIAGIVFIVTAKTNK